MKSDSPDFAHLVMCRLANRKADAIEPPFGWVLSKATQAIFTIF